MITRKYVLEQRLCELLQEEIKSSGAHVHLQLGFQEYDANGMCQMPVIAEFENANEFSNLLQNAMNRYV